MCNQLNKHLRGIFVSSFILCALIVNAADPPLQSAGDSGEPAEKSIVTALPFIEDFEGSFPPTDWYEVGFEPPPYTWHQISIDPYSGSYCVSCDYYSESLLQEAYLQTPSLDLSAAGPDLRLVFSWKGGSYTNSVTNDGCDLYVEISTDGSTFPTIIWDEESIGVWEDNTWYRDTISLNGYNLPIIKIEFRYRGSTLIDGDSFTIDLVEIFEQSPNNTSFHVSTLADAGAGSLREAITQANSDPGPDSIIFDLAGTIALASGLPSLSGDSTLVLGSTAPGGAQSVVLDGTGTSGANGLELASHGNIVEGLTIQNFNDGIAVNGTARANHIGPDNLITGSSGHGVSFNGVGTDSNLVSGNTISGNSLNGVYGTGTTFNQIGGYTAAEFNEIFDNGQSGIYFYANSDSNRVIGNQIGVPTGSLESGNIGDGILIDFNSDGNLIDSNLVATNGGDGIAVTINSRINTITRNLIYDNGQMGIDLGDDGVTANDGGDGDTGPNDLLNFPVVDSIPAILKVPTPIYGHAGANDHIELYVAETFGDATQNADPSGYGEAYEYLGATDADGSGNFVYIPDVTLTDGSIITCTATDASGNTSEFAFNVTYVESSDTPPIELTSLDDSGPGSLRDAVDQANTHIGADTIIFNTDGTIALTSPLPTFTDDSTVILGSSAPSGSHSIVLDASGLVSGNGININSSGNVVEGLVITGAPGNGIIVTGASAENNTITQNLIFDNGGIAIDLGDDGVTINDAGDTDTGPNDLLNYPEIDSIVSHLDETYTIYGHAAGDATVELFVAHPANDETKPTDPSGNGEAWAYLGQTTSAAGGEFSFHDIVSEHFSVITCTVTDGTGNTSEMSVNFALLPRPLIVMAITYDPIKGDVRLQNGVNIIVTDPNGDSYGMNEDNVIIDEIPGDQYYVITVDENDSLVVPEPLIGEYTIDFIGSGDGGSGSLFAGIIKVDGSQQVIIIVDGGIPGYGQVTSATYTYDEDEAFYANGDANGDDGCNIGDAVYVVNYVFKSGPAPVPVLAGDANCDGFTNIADAVYIVNYVFKNGDPPCNLQY